MKKRIIALFICIVIGIGGIAIVISNKKRSECIAAAIQIKSVVVDHNNLPLADVKVYEDAIVNKERAISNSQGEFKFYSGVCGEITLQFVTLDGENYTKKYDRENVPELIKLENKS
ncbi:hypothetical protein [Bacillus gaemokensis]|uniref:Serine/threonine protein kinase n=1 Tax=Bacillus gaemokensis TaxID=574375 RepID=A0A073KM24_9BACI|nr:hypothetical protein [Bacillus gaemokensis]KEK23393.1 hypothetical protein BAGA_08830 [Bacillus gaemokensis]KYG25863.1 hypothetical protein AZF08_17705 [Bacillus gaemokensis]